MLKTPAFWYKKYKTPAARLLKPLGALYALGQRVHFTVRHRNVYRSPKHVICVGNVTTGGAGKTPVVEAIHRICGEADLKAAVVSRGYGANVQGCVQVDPDIHTAKEVGDEPLMLSQTGVKVWVAGDRWEGVRAAEKTADIIILDDGYQNPTVARDVNLLVFDGETGIGNGCLLPAGPLRENMSAAVLRAEASVIIGKDKTGLARRIKAINPNCEILTASVKPDMECLQSLQNNAYVAFAGIGRPEKFFNMLKAYKINLKEAFAFADHHSYTMEDMARIRDKNGAGILTTTKDFVRLSPSMQKNVVPVPVTLYFENTAQALQSLGLNQVKQEL